MAFLCEAIRPTVGVQCKFHLLTILILQIQFHHGSSQQPYLNNTQYDCYGNHTNTLGYTCNGPPSCTSYFTFRATATYSTVPNIAFLLSADADSIAQANNVTDVASFPEGHLLFVPVNCSCNKHYQHNATYKIKVALEVYQTIANDTYEGLTTCQAMMAINDYDSRNLSVGDVLVAPLMCACPSTNQTNIGFNYIVSYLAKWKDTIDGIADLFGVDQQTILDANELSSTSTIYPFNPILVPLKTNPTKINLNPSSQAPSPSPPPPPPPPSSTSSKKWVFVGVGIGALVVALPILFLFVFLFWRRRRNQQKQEEIKEAASPPVVVVEESVGVGYKALPGGGKDDVSNSWSISSDGVRYAIESLKVYKLEELQKATGDFSESKRIKGSSVFRGEFNGDDAAVKVLNGDVSAEINILKQMNHSNIIRLSGLCVHQGNTYLVYEFGEKGSLRDWLVESKDPYSYKLPSLGWKERVQIAYGMAEGLNYLHNYCNPPYVHKNLSSSNVLLDGNLRAKITNFGLARTVDADGDAMHLTKHVVGTKGYLPPEYIENGLVTPKMDVYAFGMVVLELLSGRIAAVENKGKSGGDEERLTRSCITEVLQGENVREKLRRFMDAGMRNRYPFDLAYSMAQLAKMCVAPDINSRLSISEALVLLSKIHSSSLDWDPSDELDRSSSLTQGR